MPQATPTRLGALRKRRAHRRGHRERAPVTPSSHRRRAGRVPARPRERHTTRGSDPSRSPSWLLSRPGAARAFRRRQGRRSTLLLPAPSGRGALRRRAARRRGGHQEGRQQPRRCLGPVVTLVLVRPCASVASEAFRGSPRRAWPRRRPHSTSTACLHAAGPPALLMQTVPYFSAEEVKAERVTAPRGTTSRAGRATRLAPTSSSLRHEAPTWALYVGICTPCSPAGPDLLLYVASGCSGNGQPRTKRGPARDRR